VRSGNGSTLQAWTVHNDLISEHDRRHALLREYLDNSSPDQRKVAQALRPVLERFVRVVYPDWFAPDDMLGNFGNLCRQRVGTPDQILDASRTQELDGILVCEPISPRHEQGLRNRGRKRWRAARFREADARLDAEMSRAVDFRRDLTRDFH
jgi:hypothetical protein